jgi:hypothetical protein
LEIIIHRVNTINELKNIEPKYGAEIDIRAWGSDLVLNHEPFQDGEKLNNYLDEYHHGTLVLNIKENGIEDQVLQLVRERPPIKSYFLLDVEFPYLYRASRQGEKNIAIRFSEDESIETVKKYIGMVDWVWIDTNTQLPITNENKEILNKFKTCLVCPERWGRPEDILLFKKTLSSLNFNLDIIMTTYDKKSIWSSS